MTARDVPPQIRRRKPPPHLWPRARSRHGSLKWKHRWTQLPRCSQNSFHCTLLRLLNFHFGFVGLLNSKTFRWAVILKCQLEFCRCCIVDIWYISIAVSFHWEYLNPSPASLRRTNGCSTYTDPELLRQCCVLQKHPQFLANVSVANQGPTLGLVSQTLLLSSLDKTCLGWNHWPLCNCNSMRWLDLLCCAFMPHIHLPKKCRQCNKPASHHTPYNAHLLTGERPKQHTLDIFERHLIKSINSKYLWLESWKKVIPGNSLTCWPRKNKQYAQPFEEWCHTEVVPHTGSFHLCWLYINLNENVTLDTLKPDSITADLCMLVVNVLKVNISCVDGGRRETTSEERQPLF